MKIICLYIYWSLFQWRNTIRSNASAWIPALFCWISDSVFLLTVQSEFCLDDDLNEVSDSPECRRLICVIVLDTTELALISSSSLVNGFIILSDIFIGIDQHCVITMTVFLSISSFADLQCRLVLLGKEIWTGAYCAVTEPVKENAVCSACVSLENNAVMSLEQAQNSHWLTWLTWSGQSKSKQE